MNRRAFITLIGGAAAWPVVVRAQQAARAARVGCLVTGSLDSHGQFIDAFREGLDNSGGMWRAATMCSICDGRTGALTASRCSPPNWPGSRLTSQ